MKSDLRTHVPLFELSIFLAMVIIGWAGWRLHKVELKESGDYQQLARFEQVSRNAGQVFDKLEQAFQVELKELQKARMEDVDTRFEAHSVKKEYQTIAQRLSAGLEELQTALAVRTRGKGASTNVAELFQRKLRELNDWIKKEKEHTEADRLKVSSLELKQEINRQQLVSTANPVSIRMDLETLLDEIDRAFAIYFTNASYVLNNADSPGVKDAVVAHLSKADQAAKQLLAFAQQAQQDAQAVQAFLDAQLQSQTNRRARRQEEALNAFLEARGQLVFPSALQSAPADELGSLRWVLYALIFTLAGLGVFLMVAIYRRVVVAPLRLTVVARDAKIRLDQLDKLAAGLAHEIGQPLTAINARLFTLQKQLGKGTEQYQDATVIRDEIQRLNQIARGFLKVARPAEPRLLPMTAEPVLTEVKNLLAPEFERQAIRLQCDSMADSQFRADPQQLKQVVINLVQNASESIGRDGTITLRSREGNARLKGKPTEAVMLEVQDDGPGVPPEVQERLFDPFYSTKPEGSGLGLSIAQRIMDKHGGALEFETEVGKGALFRIILPLYREGQRHG